jgi:hypothetical protein
MQCRGRPGLLVDDVNYIPHCAIGRRPVGALHPRRGPPNGSCAGQGDRRPTAAYGDPIGDR